MRVPFAAASLGLALACIATACDGDLFHGTGWKTSCDADTEAAGCPDAIDTGAAGLFTTSSVSATASASGSGGAGGQGEGGSGGHGGSGAGGSLCDVAGVDCLACQQCAAASTCSDAYDACVTTPGCAAFIGCVARCGGGQPCTDACTLQHPQGAAQAAALLACTGCACMTSCMTAGCPD